MTRSSQKFTEAQAAALLDVAPVLLVWLDQDGCVRHVNRWFEQITHWTAEEARGRDWFSTFVPESDRERVREVLRTASEGTPSSGTINRIVTRTDQVLEVEWRNRLLQDEAGAPMGILGVGVDVTERLVAERALQRHQEALRQSQAQLAEAERLAQLGSWSLDLVKNELSWSDQIYRIFELDPEQFGASYEAFLAAVHPADRELVDTAYQRSLQTKEPYEIVHRLVMGDGRVKHVRERGRTSYDASGRALRSVGTVQDITSQTAGARRLRAIFDGVFAFIGVLDLEGNLVEANRTSLDLAGLRREDVLGKPFSTAYWWSYSPESQEKVRGG